MNVKKFYSIDLDTKKAEKLKTFLRFNAIYFEPSACYNLIHFEIKADTDEAEAINNFLGTLN